MIFIFKRGNIVFTAIMCFLVILAYLTGRGGYADIQAKQTAGQEIRAMFDD